MKTEKIDLNSQIPAGYIAIKCEVLGNVLLTFLEKETEKLDISNSKIWIGKNKKLYYLLQDKLDAINVRRNQPKIDFETFFYNNFSYVTITDTWFQLFGRDFVKCDCKEILPSDLGIQESEYRPILRTHDGVELFENDNFWAVYKDSLKFDKWENNWARPEITDRTNFTLTINTPIHNYCDKLIFSSKQAAEKWICNEKEIKLLVDNINQLTDDSCDCNYQLTKDLIQETIDSLQSELNSLKEQNHEK